MFSTVKRRWVWSRRRMGEMAMDLTQAGAILKAEREKRNLSVEDVARHLKIGPRQIRALESGETESVVHPAYAKGFIRSYAAWLGLTPEDLQAREQGEDGSGLAREGNSPKTQGKKGHIGLWLFILLVILGCFAYYAWSQNFWDFFEGEAERSETVSSALPTAEEYLAKKDEEAIKTQEEQPAPAVSVAAPVDIPDAVRMPGASAEEKKAPAEAEQAVSAPPPAGEPGEAATNTSQEAVAPATAEAGGSGGNHKLVITAIEECWVHSNSDKTDTRQFSLRKGDTFALTFTDTLELKLGNAGGVRLRYDGKDMPAPGTSGQVRTIVFPPEE